MLDLIVAELTKIDAEMGSGQSLNIPQLFKRIPLEVFGKLLLDVPKQYPHIKDFFPSMASDEIQNNWTGTHGEMLLGQSVAFIKTMIFGYAAITGRKVEHASILDYGCGWGRLIRLLYKYSSIENIYGVDPWDESIKICLQNGVRGNLAISEYVPRFLPFERQFDLIFAFSVFSHLSEKTTHIVLETLRKYADKNGLLVITIRPKEYWQIHNKGKRASEMAMLHEENGFAFLPHNRPPIDGDITYGDTSISLDYFDQHFPQWKIEAVEYNAVDPYQIILCLAPV